MQLFGLMEDARSVPRFSAGFSSGDHGLRSSDGRLLGTTARSPTLSQCADTRGSPRSLAARENLNGAFELRIAACGVAQIERDLDGRGDAYPFQALAVHEDVFDREQQ